MATSASQLDPRPRRYVELCASRLGNVTGGNDPLLLYCEETRAACHTCVVTCWLEFVSGGLTSSACDSKHTSPYLLPFTLAFWLGIHGVWFAHAKAGWPQ